MRRKLSWALAILLMVALPCAALAEAVLGEYIYGNWSAWSTRKVEPTESLEVETRQANRLIVKDVFSYKRFVYYNTDREAWYATCFEALGSFMRAGSGRWETREFDEALAPIGYVNGEAEYKGHWFFEQKQQQIEKYEPITQYRKRTMRRVECELDRQSVLLGVGEKHKIAYKLAEGVTGVSFQSSDSAVASVSATGEILAHSVGNCDISLMRGDVRIEQLHLVVGEKLKAAPEGILSIGVDGLGFLAPRNGSAKPGANLMLAGDVKPEKRYFRMEQSGQGSFKIRLISAQILCVGLPQKQAGLELIPKGESASTQFSAFRTKSGQYLICPADDPSRFLAASEAGQIELRSFDVLDRTQQWRVTRESDDALDSGAWIAPVVRNGKSYMAQNFDEKVHKGVDIGSNGERVSIVSVASGRVVYAFDGCEHDYGKKKDKNGEFPDPCGKERTFGNVVIIEHDNGLRTTYAHLSRVKVREGDKVVQGQVIGLSGSTGYSSSVHLHFEVKNGAAVLNPRLYIDLPKLEKRILP